MSQHVDDDIRPTKAPKKWLDSTIARIPSNYPAPLKGELKNVFQAIADHPTLWSDDEITGLRKIFTSSENSPVFAHLGRFIDPVWWNDVIGIFKDAYTETAEARQRKIGVDLPSDDEDEETNKNNKPKNTSYISAHAETAWGYADIAQKAIELRHSLSRISPKDEGYREGVENLTVSSELDKTLLQLIAANTDCHWPKAELALDYGIGDPTLWQHAIQLQEAERRPVYRVKKMGVKEAAKYSEDEIQALPENEAEFLGYVYRRNDKYLDACKGGPAPMAEYYEFQIIGRNDPTPPVFEPVVHERKFTAWPQTFLRNLIDKLDEYSAELGRPQRIWDNGSQNGISRNDPLWLSVEHCLALSEYKISEDGKGSIRELLRA